MALVDQERTTFVPTRVIFSKGAFGFGVIVTVLEAVLLEFRSGTVEATVAELTRPIEIGLGQQTEGDSGPLFSVPRMKLRTPFDWV